MQRSLEWVTSLLEVTKGHSGGYFSLIQGRPSPSPKIIVTLQHPQWGTCLVHVAQGEGATFLRNELSAIRRCHDLGLDENIPKLLHWEDNGCLVAYVTPQYGRPKRLPLETSISLISPIHLATGIHARLADTPVFASIQAWHQQIGGSQTAIGQVLHLASELDSWVLSGITHRDFGWDNVLTNGRAYVIIDWEYSQPDYPSVFDLFQYYVYLDDTTETKMKQLVQLVESPEVAIPASYRSHYIESVEAGALRAIVGIWLADYLKIRFELAQKTRLTDPYKVEGWTWLAHWNSVVSDL